MKFRTNIIILNNYDETKLYTGLRSREKGEKT